MTVILNDKTLTVEPGTTLAQLLDAQNIKPSGIATAVNGNVVPAVNRAATPLADGDKIIIITAFYGG